MLEIREIFKTIQKYYGLLMNNGDENSNCIRYSECNEESQSLCELSLIAQDNENYSYLRHTERKRKYPVTNTKGLSCNKSSYLEKNNRLDCFGSKEPHNDDTNSVILSESGFADGRREASLDSLIFPRPLRERVRVRGVNKNNNKRLITDWIVSHTLTMTKNFTNNAILRGLNNCSPQNDRKNICCLSRGEVRRTIRKAAFTLAEVLITLGIIGVVAVLTLPTLIQNHQKQVYVTQLKKTYSTINNAFNKMAADEGVVDWNQTCFGTYVSTENENECFERLTKQLNILNSKKRGENCNADWCRSSTLDEWTNLSSFILITQDGTQYIFACGMPALVVDVNGPTKGPNLAGRDIFEFYVDNNNKIEPIGATFWEPNAWKNCSATNLSTICTAKVLIEGKMNY